MLLGTRLLLVLALEMVLMLMCMLMPWLLVVVPMHVPLLPIHSHRMGCQMADRANKWLRSGQHSHPHWHVPWPPELEWRRVLRRGWGMWSLPRKCLRRRQQWRPAERRMMERLLGHRTAITAHTFILCWHEAPSAHGGRRCCRRRFRGTLIWLPWRLRRLGRSHATHSLLSSLRPHRR